jgi:iron complex outermembrane receptor protein
MLLSMLFATLVVASPEFAPLPRTAWSLSGRVTDTAGIPIPSAQVVIEEAHRSATTDRDGRYRLSDVPEGVYGVSYRAIGFRPVVVRVTIGGEDVVRDVALHPSLVELAPIQVTATPLATSALESPQPLAVLQGADLRSAQAASLGDVLAGLPGVRALSTGGGIAKPVIRGLGGNRVLVLDDGQRTESQQWGDEHAPNVETATAERIEVVRGPASVLYGSDALGGVINVVARELPDARDGGSSLGGRIDAAWASNGRAPEGTLLVEGAAAGLGFRGSLTGRESDDVTAPGGPLFNSGYAMTAGGGAAGFRAGWGSVVAKYSRRNERVEIHEDPAEDPAATPFQRIGTDRAGVTGNFSLGTSRFEADLGWERNERREFESQPAEADGELELGLRSATVTGNLHLHHAASARVAGVLGVQGHRIDVTTFGEETLVPGSRTTNVAAYLFEQVDLDRVQLALGARVDRRTLANDAAPDLGLEAGERDWTAISGNAGLLYRLGGSMALVLNLGRGFRAPSAFELFADGVHEGTVRYEVGDATLDTERSLNLDAAFRVQSRVVQAEVGAFANRVSGYIYPDPTGAFDPESGLQVYQITQGDAVLTGLEVAVELHATDWLHLGAGADLTRGQNSTSDQPLAFIAPLRLSGSLRVEGPDRGMVALPWLEAAVESHARQSRIDPDDLAPDGYTLASLAAGATIGRLELSVRARNLFDLSYRPFLSRYKLYADEMGRSVTLRAGVAF